MKVLVGLSRLLVGSLFIVSGLIKANDTLGFSYKLTEYFEPGVLNMEFLIPFSWEIAFLVCVVEIVLGAAVLFGEKMKSVSWILLGMILFFTWLTFYSAYFNKVTDCGCFGDALKLTPWESFTKDVVLLFFVLIIFFFSRTIKPLSEREKAWMLPISLLLIVGFSVGVIGWWFPVWFTILMYALILGSSKLVRLPNSRALVVSTIISFLFSGHTVYYLPIQDFRPYAVGKSIPEGMKSAQELGLEAPVYATLYKLKHKTSGEEMEISSDEYMSQQLWNEWDFVESIGEPYKVKDGYEPPIHDFAIHNANEEEVSEEILHAESPVLLFIAYDINHSDKSCQEEVNALYKQAILAGWKVYGLTASLKEEVLDFKRDTDSYLEYLTADGIVLKTIVRSNPGLVLLNKGVVKAKSPCTDFPDFAELKAAL